MSETINRSEYPRPEAKRKDWKCLNGKWRFEFDKDRKGLKNHWYLPENSHFSSFIQVPFVFQSELSGINSQEFIDTVWYAREFEIPSKYFNKNILLHFGAVDYKCQVFINGTYVGEHEGGLTPFSFNITDFLTDDKSKEQNVVVRVWDPPFDPSIPRGKQTTKTFLDGCSYEKTLGIWQTVWLEFVNSPYFERDDYYIRADLKKGVIKANISVSGIFDPNYVIEAELFDGTNSMSTVAFIMGNGLIGLSNLSNELELKFNPDEINLWTPKSPKLYQIHFRLIDGESDEEVALDTLVCSFGFRTIEIKNNKFYLNGKPLYLKQALYQGYWKESLWTAPSDELMKKDIELTFKMGFNSLRLHQIAVDPRFIYWADKMGLILWGEIANSFGNDARAKDNLLRDWSRLVRRDRNHPSIVTWVPINESWGTGRLDLKPNEEWLRSLYYWTKSMDPTRPVVDNDGWEHSDMTDIITIHDYSFADDFALRYPIEKPQDFAKFFDGFRPNRLSVIDGVSMGDHPVMISEWGGWGFYFDDPNRNPDPKEAWGYQGILYKSFDEILDLYEDFIDELVKRKDWISGHCYTEFNDQYQEVNGFLTFDRRPKGDLSRLKNINDKLHY